MKRREREIEIKESRSINTRGGPKSKPLPNYKNIVLNRIKAC